MDLQRMMLLYINSVPIDYKSPLGVFSQRAFTMPDFSAIFLFCLLSYNAVHSHSLTDFEAFYFQATFFTATLDYAFLSNLNVSMFHQICQWQLNSVHTEFIIS